ENNTILRLREHYTDTHGFTEHIFGLCYLLGYSFMPRLRDLADQHLYKMDRQADNGCLNPLFHGVADTHLLREQWDSLVRVAASLKNRAGQCHRSAACERILVRPARGSAHRARPHCKDHFRSALSFRSGASLPSPIAVESRASRGK